MEVNSMKGVYFNGKRYLRPQAISRIDDTGMYGRGLSGGNTIAIIGEATGGDPKKVLWFTDPSYAKSIFRSGNLLTAIQRAYDPSTEGGAYLMAVIRVNPALQSSLNLKDTSGHNLITLTSVDYGAWNNQIKARIELATLTGKKVTITYGTSEDQGDNIYKKSLYVALSDPLALTGTLSIDTIGTKLMTFAVTADFQKAYYLNGSTSLAWSGETPAYKTSLTKITGIVTGDFIYIGSDIPFNKLNFFTTVPQVSPSVLAGEFWDGSIWHTFHNFVDGTKALMSGTANVAVTTTTTKLTDTRLALATNAYVGAVITCNAKTMTVVSNDATSFTGASWSGGGTPGDGNLWTTDKYCSFAINGAITFYGTAGDQYTYESGAKTTQLLQINGTAVTKEDLYWIRLSLTVVDGWPAGACGSVAPYVTRNRSVSLATYTTIQQLSDYVDSLFGFESGVLTASPLVDLTTNLDDVTSTNIIGGTIISTTLASGYDPASITPRIIAVTLLDNFLVGDYIAISRADGSSEEIRKISVKSAATGAGDITMDSALSTTYITGSIVREAKELNSDVQAVIDWFNNGNTAYVTAAVYASIADRAPLALVADTYMTGGTDGVPTQTDWDECLDLLKTEDTPLVTCVSPEPSIWASLSTHVTYMSTVGKKERRGFCGGFSVDAGYTGGLGKWTTSNLITASIDQMLTYAEELNSECIM